LHVMPGGGADEFAALLGEDFGDALRVLAAERLAGEDHCASVDLVGMQAGGVVGLVDDAPERGIVDALLALVRRERDRRLIEVLAQEMVGQVVPARRFVIVASAIKIRSSKTSTGNARTASPFNGIASTRRSPARPAGHPLAAPHIGHARF